jgi:hypothetical protein
MLLPLNSVLREKQAMKKCVAVAAFAFLFGFSTASNAGLTFRMVTSTDGEPLNDTRVSVESGLMKTEVLREAQENPFMPPGSYMLMRDEGMYLVNPTARTFARFDIAMMQGAMQAVTDSGLGGAFEISDVSVEKTIDEAGETIQGYPTRHYQFKSSWLLKMTGSPMTTTTSSVEDIWATDQISLPAQAGMAFNQSTLPEAVQELVNAQGQNVGAFPLRTITQQSTKTDMGVGGLGGRMAQRMMSRAVTGAGGGDSTTITEALEIAQIDIALDSFEIPADYTETQLFQTGSAVPDLNSIQN